MNLVIPLVWWGMKQLIPAGDASNDAAKEAKPSLHLTPEGKVLYDNLVNHLFRACVERDQAMNRTTTYFISVHQSCSWAKVNHLLHGVRKKDTTITDWKKNWEQIITELRGLQRTVHELNHRINNHQNTEPKPLREYLDEYKQAKSAIQAKTLYASDQLQKDCTDLRLINDPEVSKVLQYLRTRWEKLTLFTEWMGLRMDERKMFVHVYSSPNSALSLDLTPANPAIFTIKAIERRNSDRKLAVDETSFAIADGKYYEAPKDPLSRSNPNPLKRSSSSVVLTDKVFVNYEFNSGSRKTTEGDVLHCLVNLALSDVNRKLAETQDD